MCTRLVRLKALKNQGILLIDRPIHVMTFVLRCRFQWLTNRQTSFPFVPLVPMVPIDHSFKFQTAYMC